MAVKFMRECSRWDSCSVNLCPLDVDSHLRRANPHDPERTCKESPRHRLEIASRAATEGIQLEGLTKEEKARAKSGETVEAICLEWDALKASRVERAKRAFGLGKGD